MSGRELLVVALVLAIARQAVRAYFWPFARCRACKGAKTNPGSTGRRYGLCKKCGGSGSRQVLGSKAVHRTVQQIKSRSRRSWGK